MKKIKIGIFGTGPRGCQLGKEFLSAMTRLSWQRAPAERARLR